MKKYCQKFMQQSSNKNFFFNYLQAQKKCKKRYQQIEAVIHMTGM
jgi:hypothetical protein